MPKPSQDSIRRALLATLPEPKPVAFLLGTMCASLAAVAAVVGYCTVQFSPDSGPGFVFGCICIGWLAAFLLGWLSGGNLSSSTFSTNRGCADMVFKLIFELVVCGLYVSLQNLFNCSQPTSAQLEGAISALEVLLNQEGPMSVQPDAAFEKSIRFLLSRKLVSGDAIHGYRLEASFLKRVGEADALSTD